MFYSPTPLVAGLLPPPPPFLYIEVSAFNLLYKYLDQTPSHYTYLRSPTPFDTSV